MNFVTLPMKTTTTPPLSVAAEQDGQPPPTSHSPDRQDNDTTDTLPPSTAALDPRHHIPPEDLPTRPAEAIQLLEADTAGDAWVEDKAAAKSSYDAAAQNLTTLTNSTPPIFWQEALPTPPESHFSQVITPPDFEANTTDQCSTTTRPHHAKNTDHDKDATKTITFDFPFIEEPDHPPQPTEL